MTSIRHALRLTATVAVAVVGFALIVFSPSASHVKMGNASLGGGVARADAPSCDTGCSYLPTCSADSDSGGGGGCSDGSDGGDCA